MKRIVSLLLAACLLLSLAACGQSQSPASGEASPASEESSESTSATGSESSASETGSSETSDSIPEGTEEASEVINDPLPCNACAANGTGTLVALTSHKDFLSCTLSKLEAYTLSEDDASNDVLALASDGDLYASEGVCLSPTLTTHAFTTAIASWDADLPTGTSVEIEARVMEERSQADGSTKAEWSGWFSWGEYGPSVVRTSQTSRDDFALLNIDTLTTLGAEATAVQLRATLRTTDVSVTPLLRAVYLTIQNENDPIVEDYGSPLEDTDWQRVLNVPAISQMERYSSLAKDICSPTSVAMLLAYAGTTVLPEVAAVNSYDNGAGIFGNWSYNASFAGLYGYEAFVGYSDLEGLKREIASGYPVALSVAYTNEEKNDGSLAYIEGAPCTTSGHLLVLCGFAEKDGELYAVVNDPAAETSKGVRLEYKLDSLMAAWNGVAYFVHGKEAGAGNSLEVRDLELRAGDDGYRLYLAGEDTTFNYGSGSLCVLTNGNTLTYPSPVHGGWFLFEDMPAGATLWVITDLGLLYRAVVPE